MDFSSQLQQPIFTYFIFPLLIFCSRIMDVTIGTIRIIFVSKGMRYLAPLCGFFEVLIWIIVITQLMKNLNHPIYYVAYAGGFAMGNYVGILMEEKLAMGLALLRIITHKDASALTKRLKNRGYALTHLNAKGNFGAVKIVLIVVKRKELKNVINIVKEILPQAFYTIEDVNSARELFIPESKQRKKLHEHMLLKKK
jgi:uncharacterized protein YebE (UPF0316 family)